MEEERVEEERPLFKKMITVIIGLFLIFLIVSYVAGGSIFHILEGLAESTKSADNRISLNNFEIIFEEKILEQIQAIYLQNQEVEIVACLAGQKDGEDYQIDEFYVPHTTDQTFDHVSFEPCSQETLILLHSHPYKRCIASEQDIETRDEIKQENQHALMIIMCEPDRFSVY